MSTAIVLSYPTHGHIAPTLAVVGELVRRGERVIYYATRRSQAKIEQTGAEFRAYRYGHDAFNPTPPTEGLFSDMARLIALSEELLSGLIAELQADEPDYLLLDSKSVWGNLAAQALGLPAVTLSVVFAIREGLIDVPALVRLLYNGAPPGKLLAGLQALTKYQEAAQRISRRHRAFSPSIINFLGNPQALNIIFTSREFQIEGGRFGERYRFVGPSLAGRKESIEFPFDRLGPEPLIYISMGTVFNEDAEFYRACFRAFAEERWQVVLSIGDRVEAESLGTPPRNFVVRRFAPQLEILQRASVFITHGGMNSANEGLFHGVPLVVVPRRGDQYLVADRVQDLGAGLKVLAQTATPERLQSAVEAILSDAKFKRGAAALGASLKAAGGYLRAAEEILTFKAGMGGRAKGKTLDRGLESS